MKFIFENLDKRYEGGMQNFLAFHNLDSGGKEYCIRISVNNTKKIIINKNGSNIDFSLDRPFQVFRCITLIKDRLDEDTFTIEETCWFDTCGAMFDGSQASSLLTVDSCKKMLLMLAGMGHNMMMLYCEDCYSIDGEPYWGNMRPRYSKDDFKQIDDFAYSLGIEMIPCMQTLGHLTEAIKRPPYAAISDTSAVLMVDDEATYAFIEKLIVHMASCFRTNRIHLGLDEAWDLGLGNYLKKNGYSPAKELMTLHVSRVYDIAKKHGLVPMMWSDMYFRAKSADFDYYDREIQFTPGDANGVPEDMSLIYWDYIHNNPEEYEELLTKHFQLTQNVIFAGCSRNVRTFGSHHTKTMVTSNAALTACKKLGVKEVFATVWGDDHRESSTFATLPGLQLYAEHMYNYSPDEEMVKKRFRSCTNVDWQAFADVGFIDCAPEYNGNNIEHLPLSKVCMWQDILMGICDKDFRGIDMSEHFAGMNTVFLNHAEKYPAFKKVFEFYAGVANVLSIKQYIGIRLERAYREHNCRELHTIATEVLPQLFCRMSALRQTHRDYFFEEYKPIGWEVIDIRYGGALARIDTAIKRITDFLDGSISKIEELEEERLSYYGADKIPDRMEYTKLCSASRI